MRHSSRQKYKHLHHERFHYHYGITHRAELFIIECVMAILIIASLGTLVVSLTLEPTQQQLKAMQYIDSLVAVVLLLEFGGRLLLSKHRGHFLRWNWWYLLAAIPTPVSLATLLRTVRLAGFIKMLKIGIHYKLDKDIVDTIQKRP